mmetsp:Transcript_46850/g.109401  ORF Transcript_46850/g.109401 Transcript_46850/m.109401 type:complete len:204 (-) Transcript_46850:550-1161(-)
MLLSAPGACVEARCGFAWKGTLWSIQQRWRMHCSRHSAFAFVWTGRPATARAAARTAKCICRTSSGRTHRRQIQVVGVQLSVKSTTRCVQQVLQAKNLCNIWRIGCVLPDRRAHTPSRTSNASQNRSCSCSWELAACSSGGSRIATFQDFSKNQVPTNLRIGARQLGMQAILASAATQRRMTSRLAQRCPPSHFLRRRRQVIL